MPTTAKKPVKKATKPKKRAADVKVKVLAYKGKLVFVPETHEETSKFVPTSGERFGTVMLDTKKNLSVSKEAMALFQKIKPGHDAIGDVSWWKCDDDTYAFSWFGAIFSIKNPKDCVGDRDWRPSADLPYAVVPNDVPQEVLDGIAAMGKIGVGHVWKDPFGLGYPTMQQLVDEADAQKAKKKKKKKAGKKKPSAKKKAKKK